MEVSQRELLLSETASKDEHLVATLQALDAEKIEPTPHPDPELTPDHALTPDPEPTPDPDPELTPDPDPDTLVTASGNDY